MTIIDRPKKLSGDKISDTSVLIHAVKKIERVLNSKFDVVVMLHPTSPLREKKDIKICVKRLIKKSLCLFGQFLKQIVNTIPTNN